MKAKLLLSANFVVAVCLTCGANLATAEPASPPAATPGSPSNPNGVAAEKARAIRAAAIQKRQDAKKLLRQIVEGKGLQQDVPGGVAPPDTRVQGGAYD